MIKTTRASFYDECVTRKTLELIEAVTSETNNEIHQSIVLALGKEMHRDGDNVHLFLIVVHTHSQLVLDKKILFLKPIKALSGGTLQNPKLNVEKRERS